MNDDELAHYGKMGMKWGKRNAARNASSKPKSKKTTSTENKTEGKSRISDADLKSRINRIEMEQKYAKLTAKTVSPGKKMVMDILSTAFKQTAQAYVTKQMGNMVNNITTPKASPTPNPTPTPNPSSTPNNSRTANTSNEQPRSTSSYIRPDYQILN